MSKSYEVLISSNPCITAAVNAEHAQDSVLTVTLLSSKNVLTEVAVNNSVFSKFIRKGRIYTIIVHNGHSTFSTTLSITVINFCSKALVH